MEHSRKHTGLIIAVVILAVIVLVAVMMHYANTGRFLPSMNELKNGATEAGDRAQNDLNQAANQAKKKDNIYHNGTIVSITPEPTITHYPETEIIR